MTIRQLILDLKENQEDFEFYPTTKEMIKVIYDNVENSTEWLDIGCGTCNFKKYFNEIGKERQEIRKKQEKIWQDNNYNDKFRPTVKEGKYISKYYVMEKSKILINKFDADTICIGTDFNNSLLLDKPVINIFCNPPYSEFIEWTKRILLEGNFFNAYMIIPIRWQDNKEIQEILKNNHFEFQVLGRFDFFEAERAARCFVNVVKFTKEYHYRNSDLPQYREDAFDRFFDEFYKIKNKNYKNEWTKNDEKKQEIKTKLISADNKAEMLVKLYNEELNTLHGHFTAIASLDADILETIGIKKQSVKEALKQKAQCLKIRYWDLVFDSFEEITERLTSDTRNKIFNRFKTLQTIDFTYENIYPVVLWVIKNANQYYDEQLINFYKDLSEPANVLPYKSNQKVFKVSKWRHDSFENPEDVTHYTLKLEYRIICSKALFIDRSRNSYYYTEKPLSTIENICTIARNLGFSVGEIETDKGYGKSHIVYQPDGKILFEYKYYQNGNKHMRFNLELAKAINVEVSRLLGWIKCKEDISKEFPENLAKGAEKYFKKNNCISLVDSKYLLLTTKAS